MRIYVIHGLMGTARQHFGPQLEEWNSSHEVIPLDLPGHGPDSDEAPTPYFSAARAWAAQQMACRGSGHIVGLSLGASVAMHLAIEYPQLCESLVLTGYAPAIPEDLRPLMEQQYQTFSKISETAPDVAAEFALWHGEKWYRTLMAVMDDMTFHYPTVAAEQIQRLRVPTLVLNGAQEAHERQAACEMADLNGHVRVGLIPGAGHTAELQQPALYNLMVKTFWDQLERAAAE